MICYRDMTFCTRSDDCSVKDCFRKVTQEVKDDAKTTGLGLAMGDMSQTCKTGFRPIVATCPGCGWTETSIAIELAKVDFECRGCGMHRLSDFK